MNSCCSFPVLSAACAALANNTASASSAAPRTALVERYSGIERVVEVLRTNIDPLRDQPQLRRRKVPGMRAARSEAAEESCRTAYRAGSQRSRHLRRGLHRLSRLRVNCSHNPRHKRPADEFKFVAGEQQLAVG